MQFLEVTWPSPAPFSDPTFYATGRKSLHPSSSPDPEEPPQEASVPGRGPAPSPSETSNLKHIFSYKISDFSESNKYLPCPLTKEQQSGGGRRREKSLLWLLIIES
jgi:hypothetical protein